MKGARHLLDEVEPPPAMPSTLKRIQDVPDGIVDTFLIKDMPRLSSVAEKSNGLKNEMWTLYSD